MKLIKDFDEAMTNKLIRKFSHWEFSNLNIKHGKRESNVELTYGLAYTSSSEYAGLWNTNTSAVYATDSSLRFDGIGYDVELNPVAIFTRLDESGSEMEDVTVEIKN